MTILAADVFYARHLHRSNHVLWASTSPLPDLGGKEEDDQRLTGSADHVMSLNFPAAYNTVCVEVPWGLYLSVCLEAFLSVCL